MPIEHSHAHCADEKTEAPKGEMTFLKAHGQVFCLQTTIPDLIMSFRPGVATGMSGSTAWGSKKGMGFSEELMNAMQEWTGQALPQTHR